MIVKDTICFRNTSGRSSPRRRCTRRSRSHARWAGRAAARPQSKPRCGGGGRATFGSGGARKYGCDQTGCGGLSVVEQPASLIGALNSPRDKSADKQQSLETKPISRGTESSNPAPSSRQSVSSGISPSCVEKPAVAAACAGMARRHDRQRPIGLVTITPIAGNVSVGRYSSTAAPKRGGLRTVVALVPSEGG